ncbi:MAG: AMP-dependent synthetase, partial [Congregibacter sp.]|nr:AMP-dependent synthetase [Congregibacter sp.]
TGDIAYMDDDGFVYLVDRAKDMVLRGGENVYCAEVESTLFDFEGVAECAVFAVPDDRLGEVVGAAIYTSDTRSFSVDALREHCGKRLAAFKIPQYVWLVSDPLPRNANGKFLKRDLQSSLNVTDAL